jgi:hypothetical protein
MCYFEDTYRTYYGNSSSNPLQEAWSGFPIAVTLKVVPKAAFDHENSSECRP